MSLVNLLVSQGRYNNYLWTNRPSTDIDILTNEYLRESRKCNFNLGLKGSLEEMFLKHCLP